MRVHLPLVKPFPQILTKLLPLPGTFHHQPRFYLIVTNALLPILIPTFLVDLMIVNSACHPKSGTASHERQHSDPNGCPGYRVAEDFWSPIG
ncbi:hypothetical protein GQ43DRAFT_177075 [Delitschia confertaspora ATCC 74209]|uniref:Uncharacterized protein n=1 Tax=Delitschia confertaspora ATCC 74209 TaxID=1513339 RepID=A0A9P4MSN1_9PLEO|nr:hypothetical protein GQ43DRAFT_177075 [Delitschia confertaspora ATCC 74209]